MILLITRCFGLEQFKIRAGGFLFKAGFALYSTTYPRSLVEQLRRHFYKAYNISLRARLSEESMHKTLWIGQT